MFEVTEAFLNAFEKYVTRHKHTYTEQEEKDIITHVQLSNFEMQLFKVLDAAIAHILKTAMNDIIHYASAMKDIIHYASTIEANDIHDGVVDMFKKYIDLINKEIKDV